MKKAKKAAAAATKRTVQKNDSGSSAPNNMKDGSKSKMASGSKDLCGDSTRKKNDEKTVNKEVSFIVLQKI